MGEFARQVRRRAARVLREVFGHDPLPEENPVVELVWFLMGAGSEDIQPLPTVSISDQHRRDWYYIWLMNPQELIAAMNFVLETERRGLPEERGAMELWAASLLLSTLAQLEMM